MLDRAKRPSERVALAWKEKKEKKKNGQEYEEKEKEKAERKKREEGGGGGWGEKGPKHIPQMPASRPGTPHIEHEKNPWAGTLVEKRGAMLSKRSFWGKGAFRQVSLSAIG